MEIELFQECIKETYFEKDSHKGINGTFLWFVEEVGELANAIRKGNGKEMETDLKRLPPQRDMRFSVWLFTQIMPI